MADVIAPNDSAVYWAERDAAARESVDSYALPKIEADQVEHTISTIKISPQASFSGVVDAILEVAKQRTTLLDQLRMTLVSGNDAEALRFARQLCGLPGSEWNEKGY